MKISCGKCGTKYTIDESKIKGESARYKCTICSAIIVVKNPNAPPTAWAPPPTPSPPTSQSTTVSGSAPGQAQKVRFGITGKVIILILLTSLFPFGAFWGLSFYKQTGYIRKQTQKQMEQITFGLSRHVDEWADKHIRMLRTAAEILAMEEMTAQAHKPIMEDIKKNFPWAYLVMTMDDTGMNIARNDDKPLKNYSFRTYWSEIMEGKEVSSQTMIGKTSKKPSMALSVPIKMKDYTVGVLAIAATIDQISKNIVTWTSGKTGYAFMVDQTGKVVAHQDPNYVLEQKVLKTQKGIKGHPLVDHYFKTRKAGFLEYKNEKGKDTLGYIVGTKEFGWVVAIEQERKEVYKDLMQTQGIAIIMLVAIVIFETLIAWISARSIVKPIVKLTEVTEQMSLGDLDVAVGVNSNDEIGNLGSAIGRMQTSLRMAIKRLQRGR